ncbi:MAG: hypothetical protein WBP93_05270 [Pyrinomonadaceae bacterium]
MTEKTRDGQDQCSFNGCSLEWSVACHHGQWCWQHSRVHREADHDCDLLISKALTVWMTRGALPLVKTVEHLKAALELRPAPVEQIEREVFPACVSNVELLKELNKSFDEILSLEPIQKMLESIYSLSSRLSQNFHDVSSEIRTHFEGNEMPFGLNDEEVFEWHRKHLESQSSEH